MRAPGTRAPDWSSTVPEMVSACRQSGTARQHINKKNFSSAEKYLRENVVSGKLLDGIYVLCGKSSTPFVQHFTFHSL
jgi:hypothetical protein